MNILKSLKNTKGKVFNFFGYENKVKIIFPFVTLVYSILYIIFNLINKNVEQGKPVKFYEYLKDKKIRYLFLYIQSIGDGMFIYFPKNKVGNLILHLLYLVLVSLIVEFLVGHKKLLLYILVAIFAGYFTELQKNYLNNVTYEFPTKPSCCGSTIYTFLGGVGISTLFSKMNNYKGKLLAFVMFLLILFIQAYSDYKVFKNLNPNLNAKSSNIFVWHAHFYLMGIVVGLLNNTIKF